MSDAPTLDTAPRAAEPGPAAYQVLARKYRPQTFDALLGQEAMVRVLRAAFATDRIHHAFILTGVRGVGKTTTARIIAKGLNCVGPEGSGGPTVKPCGVCEPCRRIAEGRFIDVLEIDAASHTGVDFVRDLTDMARTAPTGRFRVFILDEVHMLSTSAFNALLKTLEEPPPHVKFIFATTEIRKVPVTVLSRCQRFDLRRIEPETLIAHLRGVAEAEGARISDEALALIARAAEGSARDALSLMDQALAPGGEETDAATVRAMLGLADRGRVLDLFEAIMRGDAAGALAELSAQHADGADPEAVLRDLAEAAHWLSVVKVAPDAADDPTAAAAERERGRRLAESLGMRSLARAWQMLIRALEEVAAAPSALAAAEMAVIRLTHVADLPSPEEIVRRLSGEGATGAGPQAAAKGGAGMQDGGAQARRAPASPGGGGAGGGTARLSDAGVRAEASAGSPDCGLSAAFEGRSATLMAERHGAGAQRGGEMARPVLGASVAMAAQATHEPSPDPSLAALAGFDRFEAVLELIREKRDLRLLVAVENGLRVASCAPGRIEAALTGGADAALPSELAARLTRWTGARWNVVRLDRADAPTEAERRDAAAEDLRARAAASPLVAATLAAFPGAEIVAVRPLAAAAAEVEPVTEHWSADPDAAEGFGDDWSPVDPFGEE